MIGTIVKAVGIASQVGNAVAKQVIHTKAALKKQSSVQVSKAGQVKSDNISPTLTSKLINRFK